MKRLLIVLGLFFLIIIQNTYACDPAFKHYIEIYVEDCTDDNYHTVEGTHNIDVMVKADEIQFGYDPLSAPNRSYTDEYTNYETFDYLHEEGYVSFRLYLEEVEYTFTDCMLNFKMSESSYIDEFQFTTFYIVAFDDDGNELFRSEEHNAELYNGVVLRYFEIDYEKEKIYADEIPPDVCLDLYKFVIYGALTGFIAIVIVFVNVIGFIFMLLFIIARATRKRRT